MKRTKKSTRENLLSSKMVTIPIGTLLLVSLYIMITSLIQPSNQTSTTIDNIIQLDTEFTYQANVEPSELYPEGGLIEPDAVIFEQVTKEIPATIQSSITSEKPITGEGTFYPTLTIEAGEFWKKEFPLSEKQSFQLTGGEQQLIDAAYSIDINEIKGLVSSIEEEINVSPDNYLLKVSPNITGKIIYDGKEAALNGDSELIFEYGYNKITLVSEQEFMTEIPFENQVATANSYNILGIAAAPVLMVQVVSALISVCLLMLLWYRFKLMNRVKKKGFPEAQKIDKKYASRLVTVTTKIDLANKSFLKLDSMQALVQVADEKELPIFRHADNSKEKVMYFIMETDYIYSFEASNIVERENNISVESDVSYG